MRLLPVLAELLPSPFVFLWIGIDLFTSLPKIRPDAFALGWPRLVAVVVAVVVVVRVVVVVVAVAVVVEVVSRLRSLSRSRSRV